MESNTPGTLTDKFEENLVDFDYDIWKKFGLKLYWSGTKNDPIDNTWPLEVLKIRKHPDYQVIGLVKKDDIEEVVVFSLDSGIDPDYHKIYMDLDSLALDPILRTETFWEEAICRLRVAGCFVGAAMITLWKYIKDKYNDHRRKKSAT